MSFNVNLKYYKPSGFQNERHSDADNTLFMDCESLYCCCENGILPPKFLVIINCNLLRFYMERQRTSKALTLEYIIFV